MEINPIKSVAKSIFLNDVTQKLLELEFKLEHSGDATSPIAQQLPHWRRLLQALQEALKGWGWSSPNPSVGCVIASPQNGRVLAQGFHRKAGNPHAEIEAIAKLGTVTQDSSTDFWVLDSKHHSALKGAEMYVTLEPCAHRGRTPSCAQTLAQLPLKKVWFLLRDPNPLVAGRGKAILEGAGIEVECLEDHPHPVAQMLVRAARRIHQAFLITMEQKRPIFYWIKWASSLDGFMAWQPGRSAFNAITSPSTRALAREMRGLCDGIMTTRSTILVDNPLMDLRDTEFVSKSYPLFIWDEGAQLLNYPELRIFSQRQAGPIILLDASGVNGLRPEVSSMVSQNPRGLAEPPIYVWKVSKNRQEAWQMWEERASQMGIQSIWLEGGPRFTSSLLKEGRWDYASAFFGNIIIGANGKGRWYEGLVVDGQLEKSVELDHDLVVSLERDFLVTFSNHFKRFT